MNNDRFDKYITVGNRETYPFLGQDVSVSTGNINFGKARAAKNNWVNKRGDLVSRPGGVSFNFMGDPVTGLYGWQRDDGMSVVAIIDNTNITSYASDDPGDGVFPTPDKDDPIPGSLVKQATFYSNAGGDGGLRATTTTTSAAAAFAASRSASTADIKTPAYVEVWAFRSDSDPNYYSQIARGFVTFDTSSLGSSATILSATLYVYNSSPFGTLTVALTQSTQTDPESLALADYNNITLNSPSEGASRVSMGAGWKTFTLNSTGRGFINTSGWTKFCLRDSRDVDNTLPSANSDGVLIRTDSSYKPYLVVTYGA